MNVRETVNELTQLCLELRPELERANDAKERTKMVLRHLKLFADRGLRISDFQTGLEWFNVTEALSLTRHLVGKIVIFDFFTYCCINCMHVLPELGALEKRFTVQDGLVVVGVHSAKFSNERDSKSILSAVQRYGIDHPVVNDSALSFWRGLGITCWPTLLMIGPAGQPLAVFVGEGHKQELFLYVEVALEYFGSLKKLSSHGLPCEPARHLASRGDGTLLFPGKVALSLSETGPEKLVISDSGNNRILLADLTGKIERVIGGCESGFRDGNFEDARFNAPQGVCVLANALYVADTENHAIRMIDLHRGTVSTLVGTGAQGRDYSGGKSGAKQPLSSPWDLAVYHHKTEGTLVPVLLIAMAGTHQIWSYFFQDTMWWKNRKYKAGTCVAIVGSGREENRNNSYPHAAGLAQPSGLSVDQEGKVAFFADSESSAIRRIDLGDGRVTAVCGANKDPTDLHDYGDTDGTGTSVKLQHPLGVTWNPLEKALYVADTYNHKIKRVTRAGRCETVYGRGHPHDSFEFDEPSGLAFNALADVLYVADTNRHAVKAITLKDAAIRTLAIDISPSRTDESVDAYQFDTALDADGGEFVLTLDVSFEGDIKLNADSPQKWTILRTPSTPTSRSLSDPDYSLDAVNGELSNPISVRLSKGCGTSESLRIRLDLVACRTTECIPRILYVQYTLHRKPGAPSIVVERQRIVVRK